METEPRKLRLKFAGRLIDLLGVQMYGGPVPSVAELVANAWDADANKVEIIIPPKIETTSEIIVRDYGEGMTFEELNKYYLNIGYERRRIRGERTPGGRLVMGRKGIGKLAGFGIAEDIVLRSVKDGNLVEFTLSYDTLRNLDTVENHEFFPEKDEPSNDPSGVTVIFRKLKITKNINLDSFRRSMARRFALGADVMEIKVNDEVIAKDKLDFYLRFPTEDRNWTTEEIPNFGQIKYWFGFLNHTISDPELRGVSVFARERVAQFTPFVFNLTGGINGQVGLEYLTGQVVAEGLDEDDDFIATDRQTVNWQFPKAKLLEEWGQTKIKWLCSEWKKKKDDANISRFSHNMGEFHKRIDNLSADQEKKDITLALTKIAKLERISEDDFRTIANSMISGVERESVKKVIQRINTSDDDATENLLTAIKEWDIISAVSTAEVVFGKIEIIKKFDQLIKERTSEKSPKGQVDMQTFILEHPWILGPDYEQLDKADFHHERGVDKWIEEIILDVDKEPQFAREDKRENKRFDLVCIKNNFLIVVLELMRPGLNADYDHVSRLIRYVTRIESGIKAMGSQVHFRRMSVYGFLIADNAAEDPSLSSVLNSNRHIMDYVSWQGLFSQVASRYRDFFQILKNKAPDDVRIKGLINMHPGVVEITPIAESEKKDVSSNVKLFGKKGSIRKSKRHKRK